MSDTSTSTSRTGHDEWVDARFRMREEEERQEALNDVIAARTEAARLERPAELIAVDLQNRHQVEDAKISSNAERPGRSLEADRLIEEQYELTPAEHAEIIKDTGPEYMAQVLAELKKG